MKQLMMALTALAAFSAPAVAADMAAKAPMRAAPVAYAPSWTGCYIGGGAGYGLSNTDHQEFTVAGVADSLGGTSGGRGWFGTVQAGCDYQFGGNFVIGAFGDYDWAGIKGQRNASIGSFPYFGTEKLDQAWSIGGRIGWLPSQNFLTYFSGGYTQAHFTGYNLAFNISPGFPPSFAVNSNWRDGWFIGGGYEYQLNWLPGLTWKTEYRFSDFGSQRDTVFAFNTATPVRLTESHKYTQTIRSELVYRFNWGGAPIAAKY